MTFTPARSRDYGRARYILLSAAILVAIALRDVAIASTSDRVAIIVHRSVPAEAVDKATISAIFGMRIKTWQDKTPVKVFVLKSDSETHASFCRDFLGLYPYQLERYWDREVFSGLGMRPTVVATPEEMLQKIRSVPGAIGYVDSQLARGQREVKVLR